MSNHPLIDMQRTSLLLASAFAVATAAHAQSCLPDGIVLTTQAQVNSFASNYPGCTTIEGYLRIGAGAVNDLSGLAQLTSVNGYLHIGPNPQLATLNGLQNIASVGGSLTITGNAQLNDLSGLSGLTSVGGLMEVSANNSLSSLVGLQGITSVGSYLEISDSPGLTDLQGLEGIETIGGDIIVNNNAALASMQGLSPTSVGGGFSLMNNHQLMDLSAASQLTSLGGVLSLIGNTAILSLEALSGITAVDGLVRVTGSSGLMSLAGLENIDPNTILNLIIVNNPGLFQCAVESLCDYLAIPASLANITGNATGCASRAEVEEACTLLSVEEGMHTESALCVFPNPSDGMVHVTVDGLGAMRLRAIDMSGRIAHDERLLATSASTHPIDLSHLGAGIYLLRLDHPAGSYTTGLVRH